VPVLGQIPFSLDGRVQDTHWESKDWKTQRFEFAESFRSNPCFAAVHELMVKLLPKRLWVLQFGAGGRQIHTGTLSCRHAGQGQLRACFWLMVTCAGRGLHVALTCHTVRAWRNCLTVRFPPRM